jgi:uncharacterized protein
MSTALITGASSGIGKEFAKVLARNQHNLILAARRFEELEKIAAELGKEFKVKIDCVRADLGMADGPQKLVDEIKAKGLSFDILVNNAGFGLLGKFHECSQERMQAMIDLNCCALNRLMRLVLPDMIAKKSGRILNVASTAAFQPGPLMAAYYATKAFVLSLSEAVNYELRGTGVTVSCLCPGPTKTEFGKEAGMAGTQLFDDKNLMTASQVAEVGYRGLMAGKAVIVPGFRNRLLTAFVPFMPRWLVLKIVQGYQEKKS